MGHVFVDINLEPYVQALLDQAPSPKTGFIPQHNAEELGLFISGWDGQTLSEPLIQRHGLAPVAWVTPAEVQPVLDRLEAQGKIRPTVTVQGGQCYAWNRPDHCADYYSRWQRAKFWYQRRKLMRAFEQTRGPDQDSSSTAMKANLSGHVQYAPGGSSARVGLLVTAMGRLVNISIGLPRPVVRLTNLKV